MDLTISEVQKLENELLFEIVQLCNKYEITYYMWVGSALAAVKYKSNIPWDDDIDIAIPNNQMQHFLRVMQELPDKYFLLSWGKGDKLLHPRACVKGYDTIRVHVDIFPLYGISSDKKVQLQVVHRAYLLKVLFAQKTQNKLRKISIARLVKGMLLAGITYKGLYKKFHDMLTRVSYEDAEYIMYPNGTYGVLNIFSKDIIGQGQMLEYAGESVRVPEKYDEYLTQLFGEYMDEPNK